LEYLDTSLDSIAVNKVEHLDVLLKIIRKEIDETDKKPCYTVKDKKTFNSLKYGFQAARMKLSGRSVYTGYKNTCLTGENSFAIKQVESIVNKTIESFTITDLKKEDLNININATVLRNLLISQSGFYDILESKKHLKEILIKENKNNIYVDIAHRFVSVVVIIFLYEIIKYFYEIFIN